MIPATDRADFQIFMLKDLGQLRGTGRHPNEASYCCVVGRSTAAFLGFYEYVERTLRWLRAG